MDKSYNDAESAKIDDENIVHSEDSASTVEDKEISSVDSKDENVDIVKRQYQSADNSNAYNTDNDASVNDTKTSVSNNESYFTYNIFIFINAIVGFFMIYVLSKLYLASAIRERVPFLSKHEDLTFVLLSLAIVILFVITTISFRKTLKKLLLSEVFLYLYVGTLTTIVNIVSFELVRRSLSLVSDTGNAAWKVAEVLAFIIAVIFAFVADKLLVFRSYNFNPVRVFQEMGMFIGARLVTEMINFLIMWVMIDINNFDKLETKIIASVVVVILNYIFSKFIVFARKNNESKV